MPEKIAREVEQIGACDICYSDWYRGEKFTRDTPIIRPEHNLERLIFMDHNIPGHTMLLRQSFIRLPQVWNDSIIYDWWFLVCALLNRGVTKVEEPLSWHRIHSESVIAVRQHTYRKNAPLHPTYQPYLYGLQHLNHLKKLDAWQGFMKYIYLHTDCNSPRQALSHRICELFLQKGFFAQFQLNWLCLKYRKMIYPQLTHSPLDYIRAFFFPFIYAYYNPSFYL
jgi:hypothetical protein